MKKVVFLFMVFTLILSDNIVFAESSSSADLLKKGLLGVGAGLAGGAASGAKGGDLWKGALAGAGVNIIGGALLDSMSNSESTGGQQRSYQQNSNYNSGNNNYNNYDDYNRSPSVDAYSQGYEEGYKEGFKAAYMEGYKQGLDENTDSYKNGPPAHAPAYGYRRK